MIDVYLTFGVTALMVVGLVLELAAPELVIMAAVTVLMVAGVLTPAEAVAGFGSVTLLTIVALLVIAGGVRRTGLLGYVADRVLGRGRRREPLLPLMLPAAALSAFLNNTPIVAMFTPTVLDWCKRNDIAPSRMLMPLSFATILGGMCTLIGTSTTLVVNGLMLDSGMEGMGLFEISWIGIPMAVLGVLAISLLAPRALPDRRDPITNLEAERREFLVEMIVDARSPLAGRTIGAVGLRNLPGLYLMALERGGAFLAAVGPDEPLQAHDRLVFAGIASTVVELRRFNGLSPAPEAHYDPTKTDRRNRLFEAVVSEASPLVGTTIKDIGFRSRYDAAVIAVHRAGRRLPRKLGEIELRAGDTLMIEAADDFDRKWADSLDFALISRVRSEPHPETRKAPVALVILTGMVVTIAMGWLPMVAAAFAAIGAMMLAGVFNAQSARRFVDLQIVMVIAGALALGKALEISGAAAVIADVVDVSGGVGPIGLLAAVTVLAMVLTEFVTNVAAAAIMFPIATSAAEHAALDPRAFAIAIAVACSASFLTPTGYQTNLMIYGPGGYRFADYSRLGAPLSLLVLVMVVGLVPVIWPL